MTRDKAKKEIKNYENYPNGLSKECRDYIIKALEQEPTTQEPKISLEVYKQVTKERDIAIEQLHELGYEFGQKIEPTTKNDLGVDCISRKSIKQKLQEHHDFFVNAYGGFSNLPQNDKSRVDEITNCIAMVVNEPPVTPQEPFINKPCVSSRVCEHDKNMVLDKIRAEIIERDKNVKDVRSDSCCFFTAEEVLQIIDKYKAESEETDI